jgi:RAB protein geranylgeranyltransferase component A
MLVLKMCVLKVLIQFQSAHPVLSEFKVIIDDLYMRAKSKIINRVYVIVEGVVKLHSVCNVCLNKDRYTLRKIICSYHLDWSYQ